MAEFQKSARFWSDRFDESRGVARSRNSPNAPELGFFVIPKIEGRMEFADVPNQMVDVPAGGPEYYSFRPYGENVR